MTKLEDISRQCKKCTDCKLHEKVTQVVPGAGSPSAEIMFIGEAPGANEDREGVPFCGAAGKVLDQMLQSIDMDRKDIYITNIVKCRPPGNREPEPDEIQACRKWLRKQIKCIDPRIFVLLGRFAMGRVFPDLKISEVHGRAYNRGGKIFVIMYHPAVALYREEFKEVILADIKVLKRILDGEKVEIYDSPVDRITSLLEKRRIASSQCRDRQVKMDV